MRHERALQQLNLAVNVMRSNLRTDPSDVATRRAMAELHCSIYILSHDAIAPRECKHDSCDGCRDWFSAVEASLKGKDELADEED